MALGAAAPEIPFTSSITLRTFSAISSAFEPGAWKMPMPTAGLLSSSDSYTHHRNGPVLLSVGLRMFGFSASTSSQ